MARFTATPGAGLTVDFDASGSTARGGIAFYHWQFNDLPVPPWESEIETTSATTSYTFAHAGVFKVALTIYEADGTSMGAAHILPVIVHGPAPATPRSR